MYKFEGKTILVTGAGSGMGAACLRRLYDEGATMVAMDIRTTDLEKFALGLIDRSRLHIMEADITDHAQVAAPSAEPPGLFCPFGGGSPSPVPSPEPSPESSEASEVSESSPCVCW